MGAAVAGARLAWPRSIAAGFSPELGTDESASYLATRRRVLLDMHIPDWDERFLSKLDPVAIVEAYRRAHVDAAMFYCQSHVGLCYWPTKVGEMHRGLRGRDLVGDMLRQLEGAGIEACGYYSVIFNNWAYLKQPGWRIVPAAPIRMGGLPVPRYGVCCPNNVEYRAFVDAQIDDLTSRYRFDAFFFDMVWWPTICECSSCRTRYRRETGAEIPAEIDWLSPEWCRFQTARERWIVELTEALRSRVKKNIPSIPVYHNFAVSLFNWTRGLSFAAARHHDFLGGDFYGSSSEQLLVSHLTLNLSERRPVEFMTSVSTSLFDSNALKSPERLDEQVLAAQAFGSAFLFIDSINPDGTTNPAVYTRITEAYERVLPFADQMGGDPVQDIVVYFSSDSKMNFVENGTALRDAETGNRFYPHLNAVSGACRILQAAHLPFGVITKKQLEELGRYKVVILPNVLRMDREEVAAFRRYVNAGGGLYASRYTSLTEVNGKRHDDFMLSDVFGCHFGAAESGVGAYLRPSVDWCAKAIDPLRVCGHWNDGKALAGTLELRPEVEGRTLARLTLPYGHPASGAVDEANWASIHAYPPWEDTERPVVVSNRFGRGRVVYSAADLECGSSEAHAQLFLALARSVAAEPFAFGADGHPAVWVNAFHQPEKKRWLVTFFNAQENLPILPIPDLKFVFRLPRKTKLVRVVEIPGSRALPYSRPEDSVIELSLRNLLHFRAMAVDYEPA